MYTSRVAGYRQPAQSSQPEDRPSSALPQPLLRLTAMASIGVGAGLFSASAPTEVLILTFAPALIAMVVIAVQSIFMAPEPSPVAEEVSGEVSHG
jgi:hypothetical protein